MIDSISIRNTASFDENGVQINDLKEVNFVYGANGTGKTAISNLLADQTETQFQDCIVNWKHGLQLQSLVYNKKFREENFGKGTIEGVFTLGKATKEDIELIEIKQVELTKLKEEGIQKKETLQKQIELKEKTDNEFKEDAWDKVYKKHENVFKEAFKGFMQKEKFKTKLLGDYDSNKSVLLSFDGLKDKSKTIFGETPVSIPLLKTIHYSGFIDIENEDIWKNKIIGKSDVNIAKLIQRLDINDWVNQGRNHLQDNEICPFCQQPTITKDFRKQLEEYFDESFTSSIQEIDKLSKDYSLLTSNLFNELTEIENREKLNKKTKLDIDSFTAHLKTLSSQFISNRELINNKVKEPSRRIELISTNEQLTNIDQLITEANSEINEHNKIVDNFATENRNLKRSIWKYVADEFKNDIEKHKKAITGLQLGIKKISEQHQEMQKQYKTLNEEIKELTNNVTSVEPSVNKINTILSKFGFLNFEIVPSETEPNHYQVQRENGELAEASLSEGEITFITFLYFMQLCQGATSKDSISAERILVVDDPISSLDSTVLFVVSTLLKGIIKNIKNENGNIKQLILLTHNVYFHKEVSFINGREDQDKYTNYWILRKNNKVSSVQAFRRTNPIQTSYQLLWRELKNREYNSGVTVQNTMRRIIENYFKILGKYGDDDLIQKFTTQEEQDICRSLICWINEGSHCITDDLFFELQSESIDRYMKVFKDIFVLTDHEGHYEMMMADNDSKSDA